MPSEWIIEEVVGLYSIIRLRVLRKTEGVDFDIVPILQLKTVAAVDRVIHRSGALSPGSTAGVARPWYMHQNQEDHLLVMHGARTVELLVLRLSGAGPVPRHGRRRPAGRRPSHGRACHARLADGRVP